jgi:hypothetical protein
MQNTCRVITSIVSIFSKNMNFSLSSKAKVNIITKSPMTPGKKDSMNIMGRCCIIDVLNWMILREMDSV